ncbi:MAG: hypothetical protein WD294_03875 [Phycisphaeraceae bacterium]
MPTMLRAMAVWGLAGGIFMVTMLITATAWAERPRALPEGQQPEDVRLGDLRTLNDQFPFRQVASAQAWEARAADLRKRVLVANGLWPMLPRTPLEAVVHGKVERDDYTVERVYFQSMPGHFVTGSLYRPRGEAEMRRPAVLSPHGHWPGGRFHDHGEQHVRQQIAAGGERFEESGRYPLQARAVQLARMGTVVFLYDMIGYADSVQFQEHRPGFREAMNTPEGFGLFSPQAELRQINLMGLQTWNSVRALDFLLSLEDVDANRIGVTGASGGATQTFVLCAIDERPAVSVPAVMVSTAMQGGCPCENAAHLRVDGGNIDLAALTAPRPQALIHADDWTVEMDEKGMPDLRQLYAMLGHEEKVDGQGFYHFGHNFNAVSRMYMYNWMNRHLGLGQQEPVIERDFQPLSQDEATVWTAEHPAPSGDQVGEAHERQLVQWWDEQQAERIEAMKPTDEASLEEYRDVIGGAIDTIIARTLSDVGQVTFDLVEKIEHERHLIMTGLVTHVEANEQLPTLFVFPRETWNAEVVIYLHEQGKDGLLQADGTLTPTVKQLVEAGFAVAGVDLLMQGEFTEDGEPITRVRTAVYGDGSQPWQQYAGYKFGYNLSLFSKRVHDVLTIVQMAHTTDYETERVHLLAMGETVGPVAAAAGAMADDRLHSLAVDNAGFRFVHADRFEHPMFVPGMVRYGDVDALLALNAPRPMWVSGQLPNVAKAAYEAAKGAENLTEGDALDTAIRWLIDGVQR